MNTELKLHELSLLQRLVHEEVLKANKENNVYRENIAFNTKMKLHNLFVQRKIKKGIIKSKLSEQKTEGVK